MLNSAWLWHSTVARDVYGDTSFKQRCLLHTRLASALEIMDVTDVDIVHRSHIAFHWTKSCQSVETVDWQHAMKAITCWQQAAADMDAKGAYLDTVRFIIMSLVLKKGSKESTRIAFHSLKLWHHHCGTTHAATF
jgi:hypothetical protein